MSNGIVFDAKIKSWGNGSNSGPWIKLDLLDDKDLEQLKMLGGYGFRVVLFREEDLQEQQQVNDQSPVDEPREQADRYKIGRKLSQEAFLMTREPNFWKFLNANRSTMVRTQEDADVVLKHICGIESKAELDTPGSAQEVFLKLLGNFRDYVNRWGGHD